MRPFKPEHYFRAALERMRQAQFLYRQGDSYASRKIPMGTFVKKLRRILREEFPPPDRIQLKEDDGIIGTIVSSRFKGMEPLDRVNMIWDDLEKQLSKEELGQIVIILAVTPQEELLHSH